jgi:hypothetical protein
MEDKRSYAMKKTQPFNQTSPNFQTIEENDDSDHHNTSRKKILFSSGSIAD